MSPRFVLQRSSLSDGRVRYVHGVWPTVMFAESIHDLARVVEQAPLARMRHRKGVASDLPRPVCGARPRTEDEVDCHCVRIFGADVGRRDQHAERRHRRREDEHVRTRWSDRRLALDDLIAAAHDDRSQRGAHPPHATGGG